MASKRTGTIVRLLVLLLAAGQAAFGGPVPYPSENDPPPVVEASTKPRECTLAWLVTDLATGDLFLSRMEIAPDENATAVKGQLPCPVKLPPRLAGMALEACSTRTGNSRSCVFADMEAGFNRERAPRGTSENASRCGSDLYTHIGVACWSGNGLDICSAACGQSELDAKSQARGRCEATHGRICGITGAAPIATP